MQSASLLHPEAVVWGGGIKRGLAALFHCHRTYKEMWGCLRKDVRLGTCGKGTRAMGGISGGRVHPAVSSHSFTLGDMGVFKQVSVAAAAATTATAQQGSFLWSSAVQPCYISRSYKEGGDSVQMRADFLEVKLLL